MQIRDITSLLPQVSLHYKVHRFYSSICSWTRKQVKPKKLHLTWRFSFTKLKMYRRNLFITTHANMFLLCSLRNLLCTMRVADETLKDPVPSHLSLPSWSSPQTGRASSPNPASRAPSAPSPSRWPLSSSSRSPVGPCRLDTADVSQQRSGMVDAYWRPKNTHLHQHCSDWSKQEAIYRAFMPLRVFR